MIYRNAYTYDTADRLYQVYDDPTGQSPTLVATYNYDVNGNRSLLYYDQVGLGASYLYNDSNQLTEISSAPASFTYTVDALGRRTNVSETLSLIGGGTVSYAVDYAYDDLSRLIQDKRDKTGAGTLYDTGDEYDAVGNRLAKIDNLTQQPTDNYTYWPGTDKLFQINGADDRSYDPNGNTTDRSGGDVYEYDYDNMLKRVIKQDGTTYEYYYDPDGARIRKEKIENGQIVEATNYIIDADATYAQVILEIDDQNAIMASYTYGDDLLKVSRNGEYFYWYDGLGSVRIITDTTGAAANRYTYDAYGNLVDGEYAETIANEYKFTGERVDAETGFVYLRARYYERETGRFISMDPFAGVEYDPASLHKYIYAGNDPLQKTDPSGLSFIVELSVSMAIRGLIAGAVFGTISTIWSLARGESLARSLWRGLETAALTTFAFLSPLFAWAGLAAGAIVTALNVYSGESDAIDGFELATYFAAGIALLLLFKTGTYRVFETKTAIKARIPQAINNLKSGTSVDPARNVQWEAAENSGNKAVQGTLIHAELADLMRQEGLGYLGIEVSYRNGAPVNYGTRGSVRLDYAIYKGDNVIRVFDLKPGDIISGSQINKILRHVNGLSRQDISAIAHGN